ncbi:MAG TPA: IS4 family transposase [Anaerolineae bacterium]|nr:IS4 family transposase [Anaerolineae bacterium]
MTTISTAENQPKKASSVRHTRAIQRDRTKRPPAAPPDDQVTARLTEIVHPATLNQVGYYHQLGLRERTLTLPVMVALVLSLIWRQISGVSELVRLVRTEVLLWVPPLKISQQSLSERLNTLPSELFLRVLVSLLPFLQSRWSQRQRPLPSVIAWAQARYTQLAMCDGSTLDALIRKVGLLRDLPANPLAGRMTALLDLCSRLPFHVWYDEDAQAHDQRFWPKILAFLKAGALLIFDLGYTNFTVFTQLTAAQITFITRAKRNLAYQLERALRRTASVHDLVVWIGSGEDRQLVRLIAVLYRGKWYRYLTNELDPDRLPTEYVVALYWQRWRIEDAYAIVKRLLGLAYFWCGSQNAVELQVWATWLLYAVLVDLTDAVAEALQQPFAALSLEMVYRSLYYFTQAYHRGETADIVIYLAANARWLGLIKRKRRRKPLPLELSPLTNPGEP